MRIRTARIAAAALGVALAAATLTAPPAAGLSGGTKITSPERAQWMATLAVKGKQPLLERARCGGVLVHERLVLTAAHCVDGADPATLEVHLGATVLSRNPGQLRGIDRAWTHPRYRAVPSPAAPKSEERASARYDIALIVLDRAVEGAKRIRLALRRPEAGTVLRFYGHGYTAAPTPREPDPRGDALRRGKLVVIGHQACAAETPAEIHDRSVVCGKARPGRPVTACAGDDGGPALQRRDGRLELVGVLSFGGETAGRTCGEPSFAAFADASWATLGRTVPPWFPGAGRIFR